MNGGHLYWANLNDGTISEAGLDGSNPRNIVPSQQPGAVAVDPSNIYWSTADGTIDAAGLDGSNPHALVTGQEASGVAVDPSNIYWTATGEIDAASLDGSNPHTLVPSQDGPVLIAVTPAPPDLTFTPSPISYGQDATGQAASQSFTLANSGGTATGPLTVTVPDSAAFSTTGGTCTGTGQHLHCHRAVRPRQRGHPHRHADRGQHHPRPPPAPTRSPAPG